MTPAIEPAAAHVTWHALAWPAAAPEDPVAGEGSVGVSVEITPNGSTCTTCPAEPAPPPALPVTGGEPISLALPVALLLAGIVATVWSRRRRPDPSSVPPQD